MTAMRRIWYTSVRRPSERVYRSIRWQSAERSSASAVRCTIDGRLRRRKKEHRSGIASRETIRMNHERALDPEKPMTDVRVGSGPVENNPINLDMREAGAMVHVTFGINIVVDTSSRHSGLFCGEFDKAWQASCSYVQKGYGLPIDYQADVVIASCGGFPKDLNFYQSTKTLFNASRAVKEGGTLIMLAECPEGKRFQGFLRLD